MTLFSGCFFDLIMSFSSISTVSCIDELGHHDDIARLAVTMENTYQLGEIMFTLQIFNICDANFVCITLNPPPRRAHAALKNSS